MKTETAVSATNLHRRAPSQRRSQLTVDAIVEAAQLLVAEEGPRALSTRRIADRAGVSIGTLYQYFPHREAIITRLFEPILMAAAKQGGTRYTRSLDADAFFMESYQDLINLQHKLTNFDRPTFSLNQHYLMWDWFTENLQASPEQRRKNVENYLQKQYPNLTDTSLELVSHMLAIALPSMIDAIALVKPALLHEEALMQMISRMVKSILAKD